MKRAGFVIVMVIVPFMFACGGTDRADAGDVAFDIEIAVPATGASDIPVDSGADVIPDVQAEVDMSDVGQDDTGGYRQ